MPEELENSTKNDLVSCIGRTLREANRYVIDQLKGTELSSLSCSHADILAKLLEEEPLSMQDLARCIHRDPSTITSLVKKLASDGFVEMSKNPKDGRMVQVTLTEKGLSAKPLLNRISSSIEEAQMLNIDPDDLEITKRTLTRIGDNFAEALSKSTNF